MSFESSSSHPQRLSNSFTSESEARRILARLSDEEDELKALLRREQRADAAFREVDEEYARLAEQYAQLKASRDNALAYSRRARERRVSQEAHVAQQRALVHPIRKLSAEVLSLIFQLCCSVSSSEIDTVDSDVETPLAIRQQPFRLAAVSRGWRAAALAQQKIWTVLDFIIEPNTNADKLVGYIESMTARSGTDFTTIRVLKKHALSATVTTPIFKAIAHGLGQCQNLSLAIDALDMPTKSSRSSGQWDPDPVIDLLKKPTPQLRTLYVRGSFQCPKRRNTLAWVSAFPEAPLLTSVTVDKSPKFLASLAHPSRLTHLRVDEIEMDAENIIDTILGKCLVLEELDLQPTAIARTHRAVIESASLKTLTVWGTANIQPLATRYRLPALTSIKVFSDEDTGASHRLGFMESFPSSNITSLRIQLSSGQGQIERLVAALRQYTSLEQLAILSFEFTRGSCQSFFHALATKEDKAWLCPRLRWLDLQSCFFDDSSDAAGVLGDCLRRKKAGKDGVEGEEPGPAWLENILLPEHWTPPAHPNIQKEMDSLA